MTNRLYFDDPMKLEFSAQVKKVLPGAEGRYNIILPATYFYPTGGGQEHDTGWIGEARVVDVYSNEQDAIVHVLDREIKPGRHAARIDKERRLGNMKSHSAQHILSWAFVKVLDLDTLSSHINWDKPSSIDLDARAIQNDEMIQVEDLANAIIQENREVKTYFIDESQISSIPFRRPPKVSGIVRVVEVDDCDYSACGGTHVPQTGMIGLVKVVKTEIQNQKFRVHFVCGDLALKAFRNSLDIVKSIAQLTGSGANDLVENIRHKLEQNTALQDELEISYSELLAYEAIELKATAKKIAGYKVILRLFKDRGMEGLRKLVNQIRKEPGYFTILGTINGDKLSLVVGRSDDLSVRADQILRLILDKRGGKGGGDPSLAQGGFSSEGQNLVDWKVELLQEITQYLADGR